MRIFSIVCAVFLFFTGTALAGPVFYFCDSTAHPDGGLFKYDADNHTITRINQDTNGGLYNVSRYDSDHILVSGTNSIMIYDKQGVMVTQYSTPGDYVRDSVRVGSDIFYLTMNGHIKRLNTNNSDITDLGYNFGNTCYNLGIRSNGEMFVAKNRDRIIQAGMGNIVSGTYGSVMDMEITPDDYIFYSTMEYPYNIHVIDPDGNNTIAWETDPDIFDWMEALAYDYVTDKLYAFGWHDNPYALYEFDFDEATKTLTMSLIDNNLPLPGIGNFGGMVVLNDDSSPMNTVPEPASIILLCSGLLFLLRKKK